MSAPADQAYASRTALVAGASGLVGREIVKGLLADDSVTAVHTLGRRELPLVHRKLMHHIVDFRSFAGLPPVKEVYLALGTTIKAAGTQEAFRAIDYGANLAVARAMRSRGARRLGVVSAMGADPLSFLFYSRVKGDLEHALSELGYETVVIARPSFLVGDRESLGQPTRAGEKLALVAGRWLGPLLPRDYKPIAASAVARALLAAVPATRGLRMMSSGQMQG